MKETMVNVMHRIMFLSGLFVVAICGFIILFKMNVAAAPSIEFMDITTDEKSEINYNKDIVLIRYANRYYLVDTGEKEDIRKNAGLNTVLTDMVREGKYLSGIIISHNYAGHNGNLEQILMTKGLITNNTFIYYNASYLGEKGNNIEVILKKAERQLKKYNIHIGDNIVAIKPQTVYNAVSGREISCKKVNSGSGLYIYGSSYINTPKNPTATQIYDRSLVVQLVSDELNAILLGDLTRNGLDELLNTDARMYEKAIFSKSYEVCKVGCNGIREYDGDSTSKLLVEAKQYEMLKVQNYVFTAKPSLISKNDERQHNILKSNLEKTGKIYYVEERLKFN